MDQPVIAQKFPYKVELEGGKKYLFCTCGRSVNQPFCDLQSHKETPFRPKTFSVEKDGTYFLCGCKRSEKQPFCDGTHKKL
ncbi:MAG: CDGSH iron-sulfur domain-containing protein [Acholeplasmataceae bacterium]|nr:CDGSH iron-sulfur domain-containing protein [Acholeplasmataceae bacterium]